MIVWYGSQASHPDSVNVDQVIAALKENNITVAVVNLFIGEKIRTNWTLERQFGPGGRRVSYGPRMNNDYFSKRGVGIDCPDPTLTRASSKLKTRARSVGLSMVMGRRRASLMPRVASISISLRVIIRAMQSPSENTGTTAKGCMGRR
ncbi:MAG: hypothetical protein CM1200mP41_07390 [Gammaproteobacteria bacterium]|nr:MAG: hypothetical protein CM1200mP41_07390 [Gammaproteobacteria bacterium]